MKMSPDDKNKILNFVAAIFIIMAFSLYLVKATLKQCDTEAGCPVNKFNKQNEIITYIVCAMIWLGIILFMSNIFMKPQYWKL